MLTFSPWDDCGILINDHYYIEVCLFDLHFMVGFILSEYGI